jgi:hypothetical protein
MDMWPIANRRKGTRTCFMDGVGDFSIATSVSAFFADKLFEKGVAGSSLSKLKKQHDGVKGE